ncbi:Inner membrane protein YbhL [Fusobacterium necrogenes]|uniref:Inner membrane protein YbhL n=1 Tax=Fusobacterium necrogenes TaxID=858 RepID=A0A377GWN6_9FUSO|nr:Bax inhibitor-1/YccA family protein [Fusobacterium necrogenes]STO31379.1 Inner membrane protein YbhL [Fusobacterium necrogenes]
MNFNNYYNREIINMNTEVTNAFVRKVMSYMISGLILTTLVPLYLFFFNYELVITLTRYFQIIAIAEVALVLFLSFRINKISPVTAKLVFFLYSLMNGILFSSLAFIFHPMSILYTLGITVIMFIVIGVYGYTTKEDLTKYSKFFMTGLITIILISLINIFLKAPMLYWVGTILGVVIFSGLIAFDLNRIKYIAYNIADNDKEMIEKMGIIGALNLYLDFINLFLYLLRIFGKKRN